VSLTTRAAIVEGKGREPKIVELELAPLRPDEVLVRLAATGICHTDIAWSDGEISDAFPAVLGHESAGVVEAVGTSVTRVAPGDRVVLALAHHCGHCRDCESGSPMLCQRRTDVPPRLTLDGAPVTQGFGTGGFAERTIVREASAIPIPDGVPLEVAAVVGCATSTGLGAVFNIAEVAYGTTVAVFGAGGIGASVVMGCRVAGAERIVVVDPDRCRREAALQFGATDAVEPDEAAIRSLEPAGFDYVFESAGKTEAMEMAVRLTRPGGTTIIMGVVPRGTTIQLDVRDFVPGQRRLLGCLTGNVRPNVDFDRYFRLYLRGRLDLGALVTGSVPLSDISTGFERSRRGEGIRTLVTMG